ncbi:hypothetical protein COLO4_11801 [Corchorus olitorius]|uniref:Uncharacterized protein n=1 Tax=Corchorus olitorius TaxID=93759 RepID=A0A1R3K3H2_9ROSI|nr:hypothetical protein COLO4_11801 [Corchorus olitorius]
MDKGKKELKEVYQKMKTVKKSEKLKAIEEEIDTDLKKAVAKTFNWENLSQNPVYVGLHEKFINMNWMRIVHVNEKQKNESVVKEFYTGIQTDNTEMIYIFTSVKTTSQKEEYGCYLVSGMEPG